jgi:hypothetical protein
MTPEQSVAAPARPVDEETVDVALQRYMATNDFNAAYNDRWVKLRAGLITLFFPSTRARIQAARLHDIHHLLTSYGTDWRGESEIAAWELGGGCGRYWPAWTLNAGAFGIGLLITPRRAYHAFVRGRHSSNLYRNSAPSHILSLSLSDLRRELRADSSLTATPADRFAFTMYALVTAGAALLFPLSLVAFLVSLYLPAPEPEPTHAN